MKNKNILMVIIVIVAAVGGFFVGTFYQTNAQAQNLMPNGSNQMMRRPGNGNTQFQGERAGRAGFRPVAGDIISTDDSSITIKMQDGSTKIALISDKTIINKTSDAAKNDLIKGQKVAVFGTENSDGSITAQNVQLNPMFRISITPQPSK